MTRRDRRVDPLLWGMVIYLLVLMAVGEMTWREEVAQARLVARRDDPSLVDAAAETGFEQEFLRTHRRTWAFWVLSFPLMVTGCTVLYFLPPLICIRRQDPGLETTFLITIFCGLTLVGWVWALYRAMRGPPRPATLA